jgi:hypothetical protein
MIAVLVDYFMEENSTHTKSAKSSRLAMRE